MTNGSKVTIYLTLLFFLLHCLLIAVQEPLQGEIAKSNKSELSASQLRYFTFSDQIFSNHFKALMHYVRHNNADYCYRKKEEEPHSGDKAHT